jgi:zinc protease
MNARLRFFQFLLLIFFAGAPLVIKGQALAITQTNFPPEPRREQLLNGLRLLLWSTPNDPNVLIKLRVHSGAAFDLANKEGTMALLSDALFPDPATREYFTQELGGRLEVATDYDTLTITMAGRATEFERIVEQLRNALVATPLTNEAIERLRTARQQLVSEKSLDSAALADRAIAARLFNDFPYGRSSAGTPDSLACLTRGDLLYARERFLNPNNATLVLIGGVDASRAMRAFRQLLGQWRKSETIIPATFRQPEAPDARTLILDVPGAMAAEVRLGVRALARSDRDAAVADVLALIVRERWQKLTPELTESNFSVRHEAHMLPGIFIMSASVKGTDAAKILLSARNTMQALTSSAPATAAEVARAKDAALAMLNKRRATPDGLADLWLDGDTFKLPPLTDQVKALNDLTAADVERVAAKLFRDASIVAVVVGNAAELRAAIERAGSVQVLEAKTFDHTSRPAQIVLPAPPHRPN